MGHDDQILKFAAPFGSMRPALSPRAAELDPSASSLLGDSPASMQMRAHVRRVAPYFRCLSLTGERGCGEDAVAKMLHQMSPLQDLKFVELDAPDAETRFAGRGTEAAKEGLIYLPEAERLSRAAQEGLLRTLRMQVGQSPRIVAFTGRGLKPYISAGFFLPELAGSLGSLRMALPTLRERASDIPMLLHCRLQQHRLAQATQEVRSLPVTISDEFLEAARQFAWPGNLPQMYAALEWLMEHRAGTMLSAADMLAAVEAGGRSQEVVTADTRLVRLDRVVQEHVRAVLLACNGNKLKAAEVLGISRSTLYRMLDAGECMDLLMAG